MSSLVGQKAIIRKDTKIGSGYDEYINEELEIISDKGVYLKLKSQSGHILALPSDILDILPNRSLLELREVMDKANIKTEMTNRGLVIHFEKSNKKLVLNNGRYWEVI